MQEQISELSDSSDKVELQSVNSIWSKASIKNSYVADARDKFRAAAKALPEDPGPINKWCSEATHGMVPTILDAIPPLTVAVLVNAVYFKGMWADKFEHTFPGQFKAPQKSRPCAMMRREDKKMLYAESRGLQVVELPYGSADGLLSAV